MTVALLLAPLRAAAGSPGAALDADGVYRRGAAIYERCAACHALAYDRTGPRHCGLIGRRAGSVSGFAYSPAMRDSTIIWTEATLDRFIASPLDTVPGTAMGYDGVKDARERHDLIEFLRRVGDSELCRDAKRHPGAP